MRKTQERLYVALMAALALIIAPAKFNGSQKKEILAAGRAALRSHEAESN